MGFDDGADFPDEGVLGIEEVCVRMVECQIEIVCRGFEDW